MCLCSSHLVALWPRPLSSVFLYLNSTLEGQSMHSEQVRLVLLGYGGESAQTVAPRDEPIGT